VHTQQAQTGEQAPLKEKGRGKDEIRKGEEPQQEQRQQALKPAPPAQAVKQDKKGQGREPDKAVLMPNAHQGSTEASVEGQDRARDAVVLSVKEEAEQGPGEGESKQQKEQVELLLESGILLSTSPGPGPPPLYQQWRAQPSTKQSSSDSASRRSWPSR